MSPVRLPTFARIAVPLLVLATTMLIASNSLAVMVNDADGDGCSDGEEIGPYKHFGGRRDPANFWDFFDVPTPTSVPPAIVFQRDGLVGTTDLAQMVARFGSNDAGPGDFTRASDPLSTPNAPVTPSGARANYHPAYDRSAAVAGGDAWDLRAPNGAVDIGDIARSVAQFGDRCTGPEIEGAWSTGTPMPTARTEVTGATLDGIIYVVGGFISNGTHVALVEAYDTVGNSWSTPAALPQALDHAGAAAVNGKIYVVGGYSVFPSTISAATYEYDPVGNAWTTRAPMPLPRAAAATVEVGGKVYVMGGVGPQPTVPLVYDPVSNTWTQLAAMSAAREHLTAAAMGGKIYIIGGRQNVVQNVNIAEVYDPVTNTWAPPLTVLPTARGGLASAVLNGRIHVVGGENLASGGGTYPQHEAYDIAANWWIPSLPMVTPRHGLLAQAVDGKLYVIGGGPTPNLSVSSLVEIFELKPQ
jgi:hypothetical protein